MLEVPAAAVGPFDATAHLPGGLRRAVHGHQLGRDPAAAHAQGHAPPGDPDAGRSAIEVGGIWAGSTKVGERFQIAEEIGEAATASSRTSRAHARHLRRQGQGHDARRDAGTGTRRAPTWASWPTAGPTATITFTGWSLKDTGSGNQAQRHHRARRATWATSRSGRTSSGRSRSSARSPATCPLPAGRATSSTIRSPCAPTGRPSAASSWSTYDPTPATWMWAWDNDVREDARSRRQPGLRLPASADHPGRSDRHSRRTADDLRVPRGPAAPRSLGGAGARRVTHAAAIRRLVGNCLRRHRRAERQTIRGSSTATAASARVASGPHRPREPSPSSTTGDPTTTTATSTSPSRCS